jgi:pyruvate kinase
MVKAGFNVARFNFSHGTAEENVARIKKVKAVRTKLDVPLGLLADLCGPKIRTGDNAGDQIELKAGEFLILTSTVCSGDANKICVSYPKLPAEVTPGQTIFLDDGKVKLTVKEVNGDEVLCKIVAGGSIRSRRGVNLPGAKLSLSALTKKDLADLDAIVAEGVDFVALSFVQTAADILKLRQELEKRGASSTKIVAKIETERAIDNLDEIIAATDAVMVARGDLAIEVPVEDVPILQKKIIKKCVAAGVPVITATQMHESMINSSVPTRAEAADVANAVFDGTDAIMLSQETALGDHPVLVVESMRRIATRAEEAVPYEDNLRREHLATKTVTDAISYAALNIAYDIKADAVVALTASGLTAKMLARHRPKEPIIALTTSDQVKHQLALSFGIYPFLITPTESFRAVMEPAAQILLSQKIAKKGDTILYTAGTPLKTGASTNSIFIYTL